MIYKRYRGKEIHKGSPDYAKGTWVVRKRVHGQLIHKALPGVTSKKAAEQIEAKLVADKLARRYGIASNITFTEFADTVYLRYVHQKNENTYVKELFVKTLKRFFGTKRLADITPQDCRDFQYIRLHTPTKHGTPRATASVNKETSTLSIMFRIACEQGLLNGSPMQYVKKLKEAPPRKRMLTEEEKERLWKALDTDQLMMRLVTLALNLPLRRTQLINITPEAVDLNASVLIATASKGKSKRIVPLNDIARNTLSLMIQASQLPFPLRVFQKRWTRIMLLAGINTQGASREDNFHFHDLRHVFGTELLKRGANPYHIKDLFAHSSMEVSAIYVSSEMEQLKATVRLLDVPEVGGVQ
jgi:integrase